MTKLAIKYKKTTELTAYAKNSRTHSDAQVAQLVASLREFGFTNPILIDSKNGIIAGHGRLKAAQELGYETVPTIELGELTEEQRRAYIIADNKLALNAGWDELILGEELQALDLQEFDMSLLGFSDAELKNYLEEPVEVEHEPQEFGETYEILVECFDEIEQRRILEDLTAKGIKCKSLLR